MKFISSRSLLLTAAAGLLAGAAPADDRSTPAAHQPHEVRVQKVIVRESGDTTARPAQSVFLTSRAVDGAAPTTQLTLIGADGKPEVFDAGSLAVGETRSFQASGGKAIEVTRGETGLTLVVDGKSITLPEMDGDAKIMAFSPAGGAGDAHEVRVVKVLSSNGEVMTENLEGGEAMSWHQAAPVMMLAGHGDLAGMNFEHLETLKGLEPEVREKVIEALHEILSKRHVIAVDVNETRTAPVVR